MSNPLPAGRPMSVARVITPLQVSPTAHFSATRIDSSVLRGEVDPFMSLDHFRMSAPTFAPHPHAGFSAVTYVLPESAAGMDNRDSRGDHSNIPPGALHWTAAGRGILHDERPDRPGQMVEGFQIFVKQPADQEEAEPVIHHLKPAEVPAFALARGGQVRILAGALEARPAPFAPPSPLLALDVTLSPGDTFAWTSPWDEGTCALYLFGGEVEVAGQSFQAPKVVILGEGGATLAATSSGGARLLLMAGQPLRAPIYTNGPFAMSTETGVRLAIERYRTGQMGRLEPV